MAFNLTGPTFFSIDTAAFIGDVTVTLNLPDPLAVPLPATALALMAGLAGPGLAGRRRPRA